MIKLEQIIADVSKLSSPELAKLSDWFAELSRAGEGFGWRNFT